MGFLPLKQEIVFEITLTESDFCQATRNGLRVGDLVGDFSLFTEK